MADETFVVITKYHRYMVSNFGRVKNAKTGKVLRVRPDKDGYLITELSDADGRHAVKIHRLVALAFLDNVHDKRCVDHINGNRADNHASNLRWATSLENSFNRASRAGSSSSFKGVSWNKKAKKWHARLMIDGRDRHLGFYDDEEQAARVYDAAAQEVHGAFFKANFPSTRNH
jgi:hypothetical protein